MFTQAHSAASTFQCRAQRRCEGECFSARPFVPAQPQKRLTKVSAASSAERDRPLYPLNSSQMSEVIHHYALSGHRPSHGWLTQFADITTSRLKHLRPRQLAAIIRSFVMMGYHPGEDWLCEFDSTCFSHPGPFDPQSTTEVLLSMAALPNEDYQFPTAVYLRVLNQVEKFTYDQLCNILRGMSKLEIAVGEDFMHTVGERLGQLLASMEPEAVQSALMQSLPQKEC